jgi:RNA polymerase sigma factor (sigma-70 family)
MEINDQMLIQAIKCGEDRKRDWALYQFYSSSEVQNFTSQYVIQHGGQSSDVDDVFQDAMVTFDRNIRNDIFKGNSSLKTYLLAIVKWTWLGYQRKKNNQTVEINPDIHTSFDSADNIEYSIINIEQANMVEQAINQIDERCQELLRHYKIDTSMKEIAAIMGFSSPEMAKKQAYRCRERLRNYFLSQPNLLSDLNIRIV